MTTTQYAVELRAGQATPWRRHTPLLSHLVMELTERCNLNCIHCYINQPVGDREVKEREMSTEDVKRILQEAADLGCRTVRFTGGEPLLRTDFEALYLFARRKGIRVLLFTNGTLITPRLADLFARVPPLERIEITIYGMSPNSYEAATGLKSACEADALCSGRIVCSDMKTPSMLMGLKGGFLWSHRSASIRSARRPRMWWRVRSKARS